MRQGYVWRVLILTAILAFSVTSTSIHYAHNFIEVAEYPQVSFISDVVTQAGVLVTWPLLTAIGLWGYLQYLRGQHRSSHLALAAYSLVGLLTLGHFISGNPDIPPFFYATIYTDVAAGLAVLCFVWWSARSPGVTVSAAHAS
jgi:hypothetical protein